MASQRERFLVAITALVLGAFALDSFILTPLVRAASELRQEQEALEAQLLANQNTMRKRKKSARQWSTWVRSGLKRDPSDAEAQILNAVHTWSGEAGIMLISFQPERPAQKGELREIRFHATANGSYDSLIRFLYSVEQSGIPVRVQRLELRPVKGDDRHRMVMDLRFSTLYVTTDRSGGAARARTAERPPATPRVRGRPGRFVPEGSSG